PFPLLISAQVVTDQPVRPEVDIDSLSVGGRRGAGGATDFVDLFDLFWWNRAPPQDLGRPPIDAQRGDVALHPIKFRQENPPFPNDGRRQSRPHSSLPTDIVVGSKVNGRFAFSESRGIRSSKLRPPYPAILPLDCEARQNDDCQKRDPRSSCRDVFLVVTLHKTMADLADCSLPRAARGTQTNTTIVEQAPVLSGGSTVVSQADRVSGLLKKSHLARK